MRRQDAPDAVAAQAVRVRSARTTRRVAADRKDLPANEGNVPDPTDRERRIAVAAYLRAQARGFDPGFELDDWLAAEREVLDSEPGR